MHADLLIGFGAIALYAALPSRWTSKLWVNICILLPTAAVITWAQLTSGYTWPQLGVRSDHWFIGAAAVALFILLVAIALAIVAGVRRTLQWNRNMTLSVILYPLWGIAQQFLILSFFNVRLQQLGWPGGIVALVTGLAFMALHVPDRWLMPATFALGFCLSLFFQAEPNILTLGIAHGWLGVLYYYWIVGRDPIAQQFGRKQPRDR